MFGVWISDHDNPGGCDVVGLVGDNAPLSTIKQMIFIILIYNSIKNLIHFK